SDFPRDLRSRYSRRHSFIYNTIRSPPTERTPRNANPIKGETIHGEHYCDAAAISAFSFNFVAGQHGRGQEISRGPPAGKGICRRRLFVARTDSRGLDFV